MGSCNTLQKAVLTIFVVFQCLVPPNLCADDPLGRIKRFLFEARYHGTEPVMGRDCAMECLAENIDWLEHHIDTYGSVVAKQPDIWGEARLTKHRDEYERVMFGQLGQFNNVFSAAITQSDNSFLAQALALSSAAGQGASITAPGEATATSVAVGTTTATLANPDEPTATYSRFGISTPPVTPSTSPTATIGLDPVVVLDQQSRYLKHLHELRRINEGDDTSGSPGYSLNLVRIPVSILPGKLTHQGFGAEITVTAEPLISDDLMSTTFQNLVVNDVVDFLGLPLVRVTERLTAYEAKKSRVILESAIEQINAIFKSFKTSKVDNEVIARSLVPHVNSILSDDLLVSVLVETGNRTLLANLKSATNPTASSTPSANVSNQVMKAVDMTFSSGQGKLFTEDSIKDPKTGELTMMNRRGVWVSEEDTIGILKELIEAIKHRDAIAVATKLVELPHEALTQLNMDVRNVLTILRAETEGAGAPAPSGRARRALNPINPTSLVPVLGIENLLTTAQSFEKAYYGRYIRWNGGTLADNCGEQRVDLLDARRFLNAEIEAAYEMLSTRDHIGLLAKLASPDSLLATEIHNGHFTDDQPGRPSVKSYRHYFFQELHNHTRRDSQMMIVDSQNDANYFATPETMLVDVERCVREENARTSVEALAWAIVVESALLNERLNRDVRKLGKSTETYSLNTQSDHWFFLPDTVTAPGYGLESLQLEYQAATDVFKEYVRVRWPIHVFAVDPVNQDQNVADVSQRKREMQFALALGFTTGQIGANSLTQLSRELNTQVETISLNRTIVGFGHGEDTFGWRFYPRVQALQAPGTLGVIRETLMGVSRNDDVRRRQIEPGQRECVAIVLMPSFVPYANFDIRTNWFKLTNPKNAALTMKKSLKLSRAVTKMRNSQATCAKYQHLYRDGELRRLLKRVDQLDSELPLQTHRSLVPYENTLGGFEMFNSGVTDLSPELIGWYGAPGIRTTGAACGCHRGCINNGGTCEDAASCNTLNEAIRTLNATVAASPLPACDGDGTTLFLVGDNFSVHDTKVIAGGTCIPHVRLISRELMQVTIPRCVNTVELCENDTTHEYVTIHVVTPYGVTSHLHVPIMESKTESGCSPSVVTQRLSPTENNRVSILNDLSLRQSNAAETNSTAIESVRPAIRLASMLQNADVTGEPISLATLSSEIKQMDEKLQSMIERGSQVNPQVDVNVQFPNINFPQALPTNDGAKLFDRKNFPYLSRLQSSAGEQWRNCRDKLPCN